MIILCAVCAWSRFGVRNLELGSHPVDFGVDALVCGDNFRFPLLGPPSYELRRWVAADFLLFLFYILDSQFPRFFELIIWILGVFESWRDYFRGWILDNFCLRSQILSFFSLPGSSSFISGSLVFELCFLIPKSPEVLEFFNFGSPVSEPCNFFYVPLCSNV